MAEKQYGLVATFDNPGKVMHAAEELRDAGFQHWDVITPYPLHGLDAAMGMRRSHVPKFTFIAGTCGFTLGMVMIWFMNAFDYPLVVGGKPFFSPVFSFPVAYELTILLGAFGTIGGMFLLNRLPQHYHPVMKTPGYVRALDDRFLVVIETRDPKYQEAECRALLTKLGALDATVVEA